MAHIFTGPQKHWSNSFLWWKGHLPFLLPEVLFLQIFAWLTVSYFQGQEQILFPIVNMAGTCPLLCQCTHSQLLGILLINSSQPTPFTKNCPQSPSLRGCAPLTKGQTEVNDWLTSALLIQDGTSCGAVHVLELLVGPGLRDLQLRPHPWFAFFSYSLFSLIPLLLRVYFQQITQESPSQALLLKTLRFLLRGFLDNWI